MESEQVTDLGSATRRDPDALPPRNALEWFMNLIYVGICGLSKGDALFALKAGLLTGGIAPMFFWAIMDLLCSQCY